MKDGRLGRLRRKLAECDRSLVKVLNERAELSVCIGRVKTEAQLPVYDPVQERMVLDRMQRMSSGPLTGRQLAAIFQEVLSVSRALQGPVRVACFGPEASFTHLAARAHFGSETAFAFLPSIVHVFDEVEKGKADWGVVPVENSLEGTVGVTLDRLLSTPLSIRAELFLRISHCLLAARKNRNAVKRIYSHPQPLSQCRIWLGTHMPRAALIEADSTSAAAMRASEDATSAAVGSRLAAETYGLKVLAEGIEDSPSNETRFLVIGKGENAPTGRDKTSILFSVSDVPGSLHRALRPFARRRVNLMKIESRPVRGRLWEYRFFADVGGHCEDRKVARCLEELGSCTTFLKIAGSYPQGRCVET